MQTEDCFIIWLRVRYGFIIIFHLLPWFAFDTPTLESRSDLFVWRNVNMSVNVYYLYRSVAMYGAISLW